MGTAAEVFSYGLQYIMLALLSFWTVAGAVHTVFIPMFHRLKVVSVNEYLEARFTVGVRYLGSALFIISCLLYLCVVLYLPSQAISDVAGVPLVVGIVPTGVVCLIYSALGGLKAVSWTNAIHLFLMLTGLITLCIMGINNAGGFDRVIQVNKNRQRLTLFNSNPDPTIRDTFWSLSFGGALTAMPLWTVSQISVQRYMSVSFVSLARRAMWIALPVLIIVMSLACFNGLAMYAVYADCDPLTVGEIQRNDQVLFYFVTDKLHHVKGLSGFTTACIFAGSVSFVSSGLNSLCLVILEDFVKKRFKNIDDFDSTKVCKLITVILGIVVIAGAFALHHCGYTVLQVFSSVHYILGGSLLGLFTLGMLIGRANSKGAYIGVASGLGITIWLFIGAQLYPISHLRGPVSISDCPSDVFNNTQVAATHNDTGMRSTSGSGKVHPMARFYGMSYLWYCAIGWIVTMVIGTITSLILENSKEKKTGVDPKLLFPIKLWLLSWLPKHRKGWNSRTGLPQSDDKEDWVRLGERKPRDSIEQLPRESWRTSIV
ncbi:sodium-coupled monocarboxylate transporter 2-like [Acropora millepora]|uniref:sodium-coupled monocarboxylate transporter 2-like n=1 Tax=Acropora millepora TaxID=45264 RepID=UPI001CF34895|nr:sodium-coupled monocarboxylate transporter 2-like [Acropora millepora]